ncbi:MAG: 2,3-bisphosphoglycerate-independent phosphoglycerate mutase [Puniceicoccales bacterium]|jgi:2,3-bisphosphoglycerate-independent phosphoglycerate mutase|nr:2,3-bisphosphoglycerate-independent phosphoglycerate mutase [Puniceicoccales bacterium]
MARKTVVLVIRDGWGVNHRPDGQKLDATHCISTPHTDELLAHWPSVEIEASGLAVGLPDGIMGNSEVGHQNIGAGRVVDQEIVRIDKALADGSLAQNAVLRGAFENVKRNGTKLHLMGLLSDGGVHSVMAHPIGILKLARQAQVPRVYMHAFMDGRDTPPKSGMNYMCSWEAMASELGIGQVATVSGRFWAMDRDARWDRVEKAYHCLTGGKAEKARTAEEVIGRYYAHPADGSRVGDEFIPPTQIVTEDSTFAGAIGPGDSVIFFNFRGDRPREITKALTKTEFADFPREKPPPLHYVTMTEYEKGLCENILFPKPKPMQNILGSYVSSLGLKQFRIAETEKYAHVTFFFNDYREEPFAGEARQLIPSPKEVATYDQKPQMSAEAVCDGVLRAMASKSYDLIVVNFANPDMVGHTGNLDAAKTAVQTVDNCLGKLMQKSKDLGQLMLITADHGNVECMWDSTNNVPHTQHTTNPVHVIIFGDEYEHARLRTGGKLADIAPTLLHLMDVQQPVEMTGTSLLRP